MLDFEKIKKAYGANNGALSAEKKKRLHLSIISDDIMVENLTKGSPAKRSPIKKMKMNKRIF
jgi:hypothetical protein